MQQKGLVFFMFCLCSVSVASWAADLLSDEQGPTAPEAIATVTANEDFLAPTYAAPETQSQSVAPVPSEVDILNEIFGSDNPESSVPETMIVHNTASQQHTFSPRKGIECEDDTPLLTPLPPLKIPQSESDIPPKRIYFKKSGLADQAIAVATAAPSGIGMPREIRITFYPEQSTFSVQALKWVKSFAIHVVNNPTLLIEIRISEQNPKIQRKRLSILLQILKEEGVSAHQIRLYKTGREENTILMGYVNNPEYTTVRNNQKLTERDQKTINW